MRLKPDSVCPASRLNLLNRLNNLDRNAESFCGIFLGLGGLFSVGPSLFFGLAEGLRTSDTVADQTTGPLVELDSFMRLRPCDAVS